jgi:nitrate reductase NapE component
MAYFDAFAFYIRPSNHSYTAEKIKAMKAAQLKKYDMLKMSVDLSVGVVVAHGFIFLWQSFSGPERIVPTDIIYPLVLFGLGYGLYKRSRICAILLVIFYFLVVELEGLGFLVAMLLVLSVIGAFRYHIVKESPPVNSVSAPGGTT